MSSLTHWVTLLITESLKITVLVVEVDEDWNEGRGESELVDELDSLLDPNGH